MKHISIFILIYMIAVSGLHAQNNAAGRLFSMIHSKDFFRFSNLYRANGNNLEEWQKLYMEAWSLSVFNQCAQSNLKIDELLQNYQSKLDDTLSKLIYETRENNQLKLCMYKDAAVTSAFIMNNYSYLMTAEEKEEEENSLVIWKACADIPPQSADIQKDSHIKTKRDIAGFTNVPIFINGVSDEFIFDSGANISTVSRSEAKKMKLRMLPGVLKIGTSTDIKVDGEIAVADDLLIGNISFKNVLFLVVSDESLSFAGGAYVIKGIIGLPLIKDMKEVHISENDLFVPLITTPSDLNNLALEGLMPVIKVIEGADTLAFNFDTGARTTILYKPYYSLHKTDIDKNLNEQEIVVGGAGGDVKVKGFIIGKVPINIGTSNTRLTDVQLAAEFIKDSDKYTYGNFGQDYIKQFKTMIINFESMYVDFIN